MSDDISHILGDWAYEPGSINARKIVGNDGATKLQLRLDLGLFQMELVGRPDGQRLHGRGSVLEHVELLLLEWQKRHGADAGFTLTQEQCQELREEALMYYHRYLCLFVLDDYEPVVRDTEHNLRICDVVEEYAQDAEDRRLSRLYWPYIRMMNTRARAALLTKANQLRQACDLVDEALESIRSFFGRYPAFGTFEKSEEAKVLGELLQGLRMAV